MPEIPSPSAVTAADDVAALIAGRRVAVLTGAGISTDSGIPDYRGPDSPPRNPMTYQQFVGDSVFRQRYWARNHVGWRRMDGARPNSGHRALARLERAGVVTGLITQNVDLLHTKAGSRRVLDLHGTYARVRCLSCDALISRMTLAERLEAANPGFAEAAVTSGLEVAPDADAVVTETDSFRMVDCDRCGGMLKPDIVYFGENVPKPRVAAAYELVEEADVLLVAGSSLTVMSGLRFVRHAVKTARPVVIINRGPTRGDPLATLTLNAGCSPTLTALADHHTTLAA
ncbi:NAD-dependent SIR2 family protein deacetylase [Nocardia transvalensis]|uniref:NAD-dependent protein deacetylase n=1 Tax=Nocardia transvalensis TaxID=37333 RepID=A0A7W9P996_9NOCA|nr:NAD-dependent protein deacetylase [Nocardia transvalensis]MBB5911504.1 NAD-dependent SIR2 family protein deacetylase [Nocardia transvalensis]